MKKVNNTQFFPVSQLREALRQRACGHAGRLSRSVGRLTSCDALPCLEYGEEVRYEQALAEDLFYTQHLRDALEKCIGGKAATLRYRWADGSQTVTRLKLVTPSRVKVTGLRESVLLPGATQ